MMIIKEPFYTITCTEEGIIPCIRCDSPSDLHFIYDYDELYTQLKLNEIQWSYTQSIQMKDIDPIYQPVLPTTLIEWKERGNELYKKKQFQHALRAYSLGLKYKEQSQEQIDLIKTIYLNMSACYLCLEQYENAYKQAKYVLDTIDSTNLIAQTRAGKALYHLRQYKEAVRLFPRDSNEFTKTLKRLMESNGKYDLNNISNEKGLRLDHADYIGPIEVRKSHGKGKGFFTTKDIQPGTLLLVSKAFEISYEKEIKHPVTQFNFNTKLINNPSQVQLVVNVAHKIFKNPSFIKDLYPLWAGKDDEEREKLSEQNIVDIDLITSICNYNAFSSHSLHSQNENTNENSGLWLLASYFNHSCIPNATRCFIGDLMFVISNQLILKDQEVTIGYVNGHLDYTQRQEDLEKHGFICDCFLCQEEKQEPNQNLIDLFQELDSKVLQCKLKKTNLSVLYSISKLIDNIIKEYKKNGQEKLYLKLWKPLSTLSTLYQNYHSYEHTIFIQEKLFQICNIKIEENGLINLEQTNQMFVSPQLVFCALQAWGCCCKLGKMKEAEQWKEIAKTLDSFELGYTKELFQFNYRKFEQIYGFPL